MNITETYHKNLAESLIKNFKKRQMDAVYCETAEEAKKLAISFIPAKSSVSFGGSMTLEQTGILNALREKEDISLIDRSTGKTPEEITKLYHDALSCDYYFMSSNAITQNGELINIDGNGNRVAALIYGPKYVIIVASLSKVVPTLEDAIRRVRNTATPLNCIRLNKATPCAATGMCADCFSPDCICNQVVITRRSGNPKRIRIILVGDTLGY